MSGYTKLFNSILASTIWREDDQTRLVWITLLAMANKDGVVEASLPGIAGFARVELASCERALKKLSAPDPYSRSEVDEGRRVKKVDGGWLLVNHAKYRQKLNDEERRDYNRVKKAESRARLTKSMTVKPVIEKSALSAQAEAEADLVQVQPAEIVPTASAELRSAPTPAPKLIDIVLEFPTTGKGPKTWALTQQQLEDWQTDFDTLNVLAECRYALTWAKANRTHLKTAVGMPAFLQRWLMRAVNDHRGRSERTSSTRASADHVPYRGGSTCPHTPRCTSTTACVQLTLADARQNRAG